MPDKVNYSIVEAETGHLAVQSKIASFGLDHVTQKEIVSFYSNFSQYAAWDTGLLPVQGSGILSIRTAGEYTQFAYQHQPGLYHVNWAAHEGGVASSYYVAQPYRIIICDMKDGNLLGARMFYSPYPITHPSQNLYHVNLPNINCKGYRGNGVGWICLYQNEDWSNLPLNERIVRFIERCSGVETYNDANMSETDGTRFYKENNKPEYIWDPIQWQEKSSNEGFEWTLDESLWIPVLVQDMDHQSQHKKDGVNLTFADALVGDYKAYYYDDKETKPINAVIRPDKSLSDKEVMSYFTKSYTLANSKTNHLLNNTFEASSNLKDEKGSAVFTGSSLLNSPENHIDFETFNCACCNDDFTLEDSESEKKDADGNNICFSCFNEYYVYVESADAYYHTEDSDIYYCSQLNQDGYYHADYDSIETCDRCGDAYAAEKSSWPQGIYLLENIGSTYCHSCAVEYFDDQELDNDQFVKSCVSCNTKLYPSFLEGSSIETKVSFPFLDYTQDPPVSSFKIEEAHICLLCSIKNSNFICPCGLIKDKNDSGFTTLPSVEEFKIDESSNSCLKVFKSCAECKSAPFEDEDGTLTLSFQPFNKNLFDEYHVEVKSKYTKFHSGIQQVNKIDSVEPF